VETVPPLDEPPLPPAETVPPEPPLDEPPLPPVSPGCDSLTVEPAHAKAINATRPRGRAFDCMTVPPQAPSYSGAWRSGRFSAVAMP
jgi:hypothetical protein